MNAEWKQQARSQVEEIMNILEADFRKIYDRSDKEEARAYVWNKGLWFIDNHNPSARYPEHLQDVINMNNFLHWLRDKFGPNPIENQSALAPKSTIAKNKKRKSVANVSDFYPKIDDLKARHPEWTDKKCCREILKKWFPEGKMDYSLKQLCNAYSQHRYRSRA